MCNFAETANKYERLPVHIAAHCVSETCSVDSREEVFWYFSRRLAGPIAKCAPSTDAHPPRVTAVTPQLFGWQPAAHVSKADLAATVAVLRTGAGRRPDRELAPAGVRVSNAQGATGVDAGSCEQSDMGQSVAGIAVAEKNRCIRTSAQGAWTEAVRCQSSRLAGTISGTIERTVDRRVSGDLVYT